MLTTKIQALIFLACLANSWAHSQYGQVWMDEKSLEEKLAANFHQKSDHSQQAPAGKAHGLLRKKTVNDDLDKLQEQVYQLQAKLEDVFAGVLNQNIQVQRLNELYEDHTVRYCFAGTYSFCSRTHCCHGDISTCTVMEFGVSYYYNYHKTPAMFIYLHSYYRQIAGSSYKAYYKGVTNTQYTQAFEPSMGDTKFSNLWIASMACA